jgi:hypothetical protein
LIESEYTILTQLEFQPNIHRWYSNGIESEDLKNREQCEMLTCNCFATFEISKYRKNSLSKLSAYSFLKWNRQPASNQESAERAQDAIIQTCYVVGSPASTHRLSTVSFIKN